MKSIKRLLRRFDEVEIRAMKGRREIMRKSEEGVHFDIWGWGPVSYEVEGRATMTIDCYISELRSPSSSLMASYTLNVRTWVISLRDGRAASLGAGDAERPLAPAPFASELVPELEEAIFGAIWLLDGVGRSALSSGQAKR